MFGSFWSYCVSGATQKWLPTFWEYFMIKDLANSVRMTLPLAHSFNKKKKRFHLWIRPCIIVPFVNVACLIIQAGHVNTETYFSPFHRLTSLRKRQKMWANDGTFFAHKGRVTQSTTCDFRKSSQVEEVSRIQLFWENPKCRQESLARARWLSPDSWLPGS